MDVLIVGSVALDDVQTPAGSVTNALGGSAVYSSLAANYYAQVGLVGVVGDDYPEDARRMLSERGIGLEGLERAAGRTFHWSGYYEQDMASAHTRDTQLNVFADFSPKIPAAYRRAPFVFLANIAPALQLQVLDLIERPRFTLLDTMNFWITSQREKLLEVMRRVDMVVVNDGEARQLSGLSNLMQAAAWIRAQGIRGVTIKKGEHGALIFWEDRLWAVPAFPVTALTDPTGAGDTFAGGFIGTLAKFGAVTPESLCAAAATGTVMASFTVEDFSVRGLLALKEAAIRERHALLQELACRGAFPGLRSGH